MALLATDLLSQKGLHAFSTLFGNSFNNRMLKHTGLQSARYRLYYPHPFLLGSAFLHAKSYDGRTVQLTS